VDRLKGDPVFYPGGLNSLGWYHFQRGEWKESNHYFLKLLEEYPHYQSTPSLLLMIGEGYLNQNHPEQARTYLMRLVDAAAPDRDREKALYLLGWISYKAERFDEGIDYFVRLIESYPRSVYRDESQYWIAWSHFRKRDFQKSIAEFQFLVERYPESPLVPSSMVKTGDAYYNLKQYGLAIQSYSKLVKEFPKSKEAPEADFGIFLSLYQDRKYDAFVSRGEAYLKRYPQHPLAGQVLMQLAEYYQQRGMKDKAIKAYRDLVQLGPHREGSDEAQFRVALLYKQERRWTETIEEMGTFLKQYPKSHFFVEGQVEMGDLYLFLKEYSKAAERYEWVIQNQPQHPLAKRAYLGMEEADRSSGKGDHAEKVLKEMISKFPQDNVRFEGHLRLGLLYASQKRLGEAIASLSLAAQSPDDRIASQAQLKMGEAYLEAGNRESALLQFSKVAYLYPNRPEVTEEALLHLGNLYLEEKKLSEARQIYQKLLEKTKRNDRKELARRILDQIGKGNGR
jgi:TolA-binding protein